MDGYSRDGKKLLRGPNPIAEFDIPWLNPASAESLMDTVVQILNDSNSQQVARKTKVATDPIAYGIQNVTTGGWMRDANQNLCHFPSKAAALAQIWAWDEQAPYTNYRITVIGPDGMPAEEGV